MLHATKQVHRDEMDWPITIVPRSHHRPLATRTPTLLVYLIATLVLMGVTEYACQKIPQHAGIGSLGKVTSVINSTLHGNVARGIEGRQVSIVNSTITPLLATSSTAISGLAEAATTVGEPTGTATGGYLSLGGPTTTSTSSQTPAQLPQSPIPESGFLSTGNGAAQTTYSNNYVTTGGYLSVGDGSVPISSSQAGNGDTISSAEGAASTAIPTTSGYLIVDAQSLTNSGSMSTEVAPGAPYSGYLETETTIGAPNTGYLETGTSATMTGYLETASSTITSFTSISTTAIVTILSTGTISSGTLTRVFTTAISTFSTVAFTSIPVSTQSSIRPTATVVNSTGTFYLMSDGTERIPPQITLEQYALVAFLPIILAIIFAFPWRILDTTIREMEPFYQLQRREGALAKHSILLDYTTSYLLTTPFKAAYRGHFYVLFSSVISVAALTLAPLSSEALFVSLSSGCVVNNKHPELCHATWGIYPLLARAIEAILAVIALLVTLLIIWNFRRESGVYANPLSIVGLGSLYQNPALLEEFRAIDGRVSNGSLRKILDDRRYNIGMSYGPDGSPTYGIAPVRWDYETGSIISWIGDKRGKYGAVGVSEHNLPSPLSSDQPFKERSRRFSGLKERLLYIAIWLLLAGTFILITYYHWTSGNTGFENFMDSISFGPRFLMTTLAVVIKLFWATIDEDLRRTEPYRRLLAGNAQPKDSILVPAYVSPLSALFPSLYRGHILLAGVALVAIMADILPVVLANVAFSMATTQEAYTLSTYIAMAILLLMLLVLGVLICRPSHDLHQLPRKPTTLASVLLYLTTSPTSHDGSMLDSFRGLALLRGRERDERVRGMGKLYGMGDFGDGQVRVDEEWRIPRTN